MALETPIASFHFAAGPLRGTQLQLFGTRLTHQGVGQMDSVALRAIAAVGVAYQRDFARIGWGVALLFVALLLFLVAGPLSSAAAGAAADVTGENDIARLLRATLHTLGALASMLPAAGVAALAGSVALGAFGWIGQTTLLLSLPAGERAYAVRGQNRALVDFAELLAERVAQNGR